MTHYYCSTFSKDYAYRGLLLYKSLLRWDKDFHFFIICLHDEVQELYGQMNLENATLIPLSAVEEKDPELLEAKKTRNEQEYAWTSKASVMLYLLEHFPDIGHILWLDGDTYFFSDPAPIFDEWGPSSILLNEGRWEKEDKQLIKRFGRFNTGLMGFKRDENAFRCLNWFRSKLIKWCHARHKNRLWSDQVYADDWPKRFKNVGIIRHPGVNVTPPMVMGLELTNDGKDIYLDGQRLVFFHYSKFTYYNGNEFDLCGFVRYFSDDVVKWIYLPYIRACRKIMQEIREIDRGFYRETRPSKEFINNYFNLEANEEKGREIPNICTLLTKDYLLQGLALYYSLKRHTPRFRLWVLCVDDTAYSILEKMNLAHVTLVSLNNIRDKKLAKIQRKRKINEFCWTLKASLASYLMKNNFNMPSLLYLDADLYFFKDIRHIYREWGEHSVFLTKLRLSPEWRRRLGKYSAGLVGFKRDETGMKCLKSWRRQCLKWCYDNREHEGLWADQKYLDDWPRLFPGVKTTGHRGINAGPWNLRKKFKAHSAGGSIFFNNMELVCYHFSGFKIKNANEFELCVWKKNAHEAEIIYSPYIEELQRIIPLVKSFDNNFLGSGKVEKEGRPS